jgi:hypothetical protein
MDSSGRRNGTVIVLPYGISPLLAFVPTGLCNPDGGGPLPVPGTSARDSTLGKLGPRCGSASGADCDDAQRKEAYRLLVSDDRPVEIYALPAKIVERALIFEDVVRPAAEFIL